MDAQRALLDELMGSARNLTEDERRGYKEVKWDDKEVCAYYMLRFCPHDFFENSRRHDSYVHKFEAELAHYCEKLLTDHFENSPRHDSYVHKFEAELAHFREKLGSFRTLFQREVEIPAPPPISAEKSEQLSVLEEKIRNLLEQVESLGEAGKVDEAEALMRKVEMLNVEKTALTQQSQQISALMIAQEKKMALCETCGSFLVASDAAERTHVGYGYANLIFLPLVTNDILHNGLWCCFQAAKEKAREEERLAREKEAEERKKLREKEYDSRRRRSVSSDRDKHKDRDYDRERDCHRGRDPALDRNGRGSRDFERGSDWKHGTSRNGRNRSRGRRDRSRSHSPISHGSKRSRSPVQKY
ncbi:hypothetical protein RND71_018703 [Anisodus tanguticus]|uniref:Luc7-like protein 3 n=1 Tax=Anisodus tanguticus TaxID=243964 RepID=A0AAE1S5A4_9SOLA|nr:hypothetical protein RND71_018703 [Anisodus tanguticus]